MKDLDVPISLEHLTEMRDSLREFLALYDLYANDEPNARNFRGHCEHVIIELDDSIRVIRGTPVRMSMNADTFDPAKVKM